MNKLPKMKIKLNGIVYLLNCRVEDNRGKQEVVINRVEAAKMIRQFIKTRYGKTIKSWVKSDSFSGGSSVDVTICKPNGEQVSSSIVNAIDTFSQSLRAGRYNGMNDSYDYNSRNLISDLGTQLVMYTSYISVYNRSPYNYKP
jgi:hypothetical protein